MLKLELKEIREQQDLLFRYMNFLKQEGAVHVLQFCLAVGMYLFFFFENKKRICRNSQQLALRKAAGVAFVLRAPGASCPLTL